MKRLFESWKDIAIGYLISDDLISFYTFFTVIFAECAYLWAFQTTGVAIGLTIVLLAYIVNVLVFAWLKGDYEGTKQELTIARLYVISFCVIFIIGCFISFWLNIMLTAIPFVITFWWIVIRDYQDTNYVGFGGIVGVIGKLFNNKVFWIISQIIVIGLPYVAFTRMLVLIPYIPLVLKIVISIVYLICAPFIALLEDEILAQNIFEIAYDIYYDEEYEKYMKELHSKD